MSVKPTTEARTDDNYAFGTEAETQTVYDSLDTDEIEREMSRLKYVRITCRTTEPAVYVESDTNRIILRVSRTHSHTDAKEQIANTASDYGFEKVETDRTRGIEYYALAPDAV